jgi:hypothetical protein
VAVRLTPSGGWADLAGAEDRALTAPDVEPMWSYTGTSAPLDVNTGNALRVSDAYACIRLLADSVSSLALKAYRRLPEGRVPAGDNARITQLLQRPSPGSTMVDLLSQMMVHANLYGESFVGLYRADGEIVQLGLIHPDSVQVELKGRRVVYTLSTDKGLVDVGVDDVLHVKGMSVDGLRGPAPSHPSPRRARSLLKPPTVGEGLHRKRIASFRRPVPRTGQPRAGRGGLGSLETRPRRRRQHAGLLVTCG